MVSNKHESTRLGPAPRTRWRNGWRDGWWPFDLYPRAALLRRTAAAVLLMLATVLALAPTSGQATGTSTVQVSTRDLPAGHALTSADVARRELPTDLVPGGALRNATAAQGRVLAGPVRSGEPLTDVRLAGASAELAAGVPGQVAAPVRLSDSAVAELLHPGQRVDLITTTHSEITQSGDISTLAADVPVISVRPPSQDSDQGRLIVVGLPEPQASKVAAASLSEEVTVTLR